MSNYEIAKHNYERGLWSIEMLSKLVENSKITSYDFTKITDKPFEGAIEGSIDKRELDQAYQEGVQEA